jgi:glucosylceramidase
VGYVRRSIVSLGALVALGLPASASAAAHGHGRDRIATPVGRAAVHLTTPDLSAALAPGRDLTFYTARPHLPTIAVDESVRYQQITGFGAAMTDSSAWLLYRQLPPSKRHRVAAKLFGPSGIRMNFLRLPMAASDFTAAGRPYSYDDMPQGQQDPTLANFSVAHDLPYVVPAVRLAEHANPSLRVLANPWSVPGWMKANQEMDDIDWKGLLLPEAYEPMAQYFVKFIHAYARMGISIDAVTPENEPNTGSRYPGMVLTAAQEATLVGAYLAPAFRAAGLRTDIYGDEGSWRSLAFARFVWAGAPGTMAGISWHCYFGNPKVMSSFHASYQDATEIVDECSPEIMPMSTGELIIASMRNWASAFAVWNVALDRAGGPVQPPNSGCRGCRGVITIDERTKAVRYSSKYYQLGQFSKFVRRGAVRIGSPSFVTYRVTRSARHRRMPYAVGGLDDVAFQNPDGAKVLVVTNNGTTASTFAVRTDGRYFTYRLGAGAIATFNWR